MSRDTDRGGSAVAALAEPQVLLMATAFVLTVFGLLMIYSASSIMCLTSEATDFNPAYYAIRQLIYAGVGAVLATVVARVDYHMWSRTLLYPIWIATVFMLLLVFTGIASQDALGATRWLRIGSFGLQPSEFAKVTVVLVAATLLQDFFEDGSIGLEQLCLKALVLLLVPIVLIILQPDKGTVLIMGLTVIIMLFLAGFSAIWSGIAAVGGIGIVMFMAYGDAYSRARIQIAHNPWIDPYGDGYQLIQGLYAFGSGGLTGVGLGMSRQKYSYLPMAHNDFIFAIIGEELGFVGTVAVLAAFLFLLWQGYRIARNAPDLGGRLIAAGGASMLVLQLLVNVGGVLGIIPLSGKPIPFLSYGGSSIMATLIMVGMVVSVASHSGVSQTTYDEVRSSFRVYDGTTSSSGFRVLSGGASSTPQDLRASRDFSATHAGGRVSLNPNGSRRIDLGPSASDRLRSRGSDRGGRR